MSVSNSTAGRPTNAPSLKKSSERSELLVAELLELRTSNDYALFDPTSTKLAHAFTHR
jgi:hypothetical protein